YALADLVIESCVQVRSRACDACLSGRSENAGHYACRGSLGVRVGEDELRTLSTELESYARTMRGGCLADLPAGGAAAGKCDFVGPGMARKCMTGGAVSGDDIHDAPRKASRIDQLHQFQDCCGGVLARFNYDRVSRREGGREFIRRE